MTLGRVEKGKRYTCIGSGHSYHMVPVPDAIDEYGQPLKARCDRDHELMNYTVACGFVILQLDGIVQTFYSSKCFL